LLAGADAEPPAEAEDLRHGQPAQEAPRAGHRHGEDRGRNLDARRHGARHRRGRKSQAALDERTRLRALHAPADRTRTGPLHRKEVRLPVGRNHPTCEVVPVVGRVAALGCDPPARWASGPGAGEVPLEQAHAARAGSSASRQPLFATSMPAVRKQPGRPRSSSQAGPSSPSRNAALAATSASRQLPAATVTSCHGEVDGRPVRGSIKWCWTAPPRSHRRAVVPLVARPPLRRVSESPPGSPTAAVPRTATSPPAATKPSPPSSLTAASTARPLTTQLRSNFVPG